MQKQWCECAEIRHNATILESLLIRHALCVIVTLCAVVAEPDALGLILSFIGATCAVFVVYIIPTAVYASLFPEHHFKRHLALVVWWLGMALVPICLVAMFVQ